MDVSKASGIRNFMPNVRKEAEEKKTDLQKQLIQLSKKDDSLAKMAQQKSVVSLQKPAEINPKAVKADTAAASTPQSKGSVTPTSPRRFDEFVKESDKPASTPTGIYSLKKGEDGKAKIVTEESYIPKAFQKETTEQEAAQSAEAAVEKQSAEPKAAAAEKKADGKGEKDKEDYGTIAEGEYHFECSDPEHKANPSLHNESECKKVAEAPSVRPATAAEAGMA